MKDYPPEEFFAASWWPKFEATMKWMEGHWKGQCPKECSPGHRSAWLSWPGQDKVDRHMCFCGNCRQASFVTHERPERETRKAHHDTYERKRKKAAEALAKVYRDLNDKRPDLIAHQFLVRHPIYLANWQACGITAWGVRTWTLGFQKHILIPQRDEEKDGIPVSPRREFTSALTIPFYEWPKQTGRLVNFKKRLLKGDTRYLSSPVPPFLWANHVRTGELWLVEGEKKAMVVSRILGHRFTVVGLVGPLAETPVEQLVQYAPSAIYWIPDPVPLPVQERELNRQVAVLHHALPKVYIEMMVPAMKIDDLILSQRLKEDDFHSLWLATRFRV